MHYNNNNMCVCRTGRIHIINFESATNIVKADYVKLNSFSYRKGLPSKGITFYSFLKIVFFIYILTTVDQITFECRTIIIVRFSRITPARSFEFASYSLL